jgi:quinoprotein glucose dehydrogenase
VIVNSIDLPWTVELIPAGQYAAARAADPEAEISPQAGTPYAVRREPLLSPLGLPCSPPPWGTLAAVGLDDGALRWQVPLGTTRDIAPVPLALPWGVPSLGGPLTTASGLVFIAAAMDDYLRAFDVTTGEELWKARLPAGGQATPMSYGADTGSGATLQFVVIAAGGHSRAGTRLGDSVVAYALPH